MATSGGNPYECPVCFTDMVNRSPKLLICSHSFCLDCLKKLVSNGKIDCPICRTPTDMPSNGAEGLKSDFRLQQQYEREQEFRKKEQEMIKKEQEMLKKEQEMMIQMNILNTDTRCQMCLKKEGVNKCQDCSERICTDCTERHTMMTKFANHKILPLCVKHNKGMTDICLKCVESVCTTCIASDHEEHSAQIKEYKEGILSLKSDMESFIKSIKSEKAFVEKYYQDITERMLLNSEIREIVLKKHRIIEKDFADSMRKLENMNKICEQSWETAEDYVISTIKGYEQILSSINQFCESEGEDFVKAFTESNDKFKQQFSATKKQKRVNYAIAPYIHEDPGCGDMLKLQKTSMKEKWLSKPKLLCNLTKSANADLQLRNPYQIICTNNFVFVSNYNPRHVLRLDKHGKMMTKYFPLEATSDLRGLALYDDDLYINTNTELIKIPLGYQSNKTTAVYRPDIRLIWKVFIVSHEKVIITDYQSAGKIYEFDPHSNRTKVCVENVNSPSYISLVHTDNGPRYIVTVLNEHSLHVYDRYWKKIGTIGKYGSGDGELNCPYGLTITESGTVLVSDHYNHRISEYGLDGAFRSHILTKKDGLHCPMGLAYKKPNLWVTEMTPSIKCFRIAE